jgi:sarcosine oxidase delta subunit
MKKSKAFFFEKKNQKTFIHEAWRLAHRAKCKSFLLLFFKKEDAFLGFPA